MAQTKCCNAIRDGKRLEMLSIYKDINVPCGARSQCPKRTVEVIGLFGGDSLYLI